MGGNNHSVENRRILSFQLDADDLSVIEKVLSKANQIRGDCGDEYRIPPYLTSTGDLSQHLKGDGSQPYVSGRKNISSGTSWESFAGYCRAVRKGKHVFVSGTTAVDLEGDLVGGSDVYLQTRFVIDKIEGALKQAGASLDDVCRTRLFVPHVEKNWSEAARAHGSRFHTIKPANTLVEANLVGAEYLVEVEMDAVVD
jgi:enamine deaminase RidA (YjgF/YER057c/UK114 family)